MKKKYVFNTDDFAKFVGFEETKNFVKEYTTYRFFVFRGGIYFITGDHTGLSVND